MNLRNIILTLAVFGMAFSATAQESWSGLTNWVGRYPAIGKENFFKLPAIQNRLKDLLNKEDFKHLTDELSIETPIQNIKGYLIVEVSLEHCSPCDNALLALNLKSGAMHVGFYKHDHKEIVRWFYSQPQDEPDELPKEIQDEFLYMHKPKF